MKAALRRVVVRLLGLADRGDADRRLDDDIQTHLDLLAQDHVRRGLSLAEANVAARRAFGGVAQIRELHRDERSFVSLDALLQDIRYAARALRRSPGFSLTVVVILGLGIGANAAMFSLMDAVWLRSLPYHEPDRLVEIWGRDAQRSGMRVPAALVEALRERSSSFTSIAIHSPDGGELRTADGPVRILGRRVSRDYFGVLAVRAAAGRTFLPDDEKPGAIPVAVVSHEFWRDRMGSNPTALGRTVSIGATLFTVVGIMPAGFRTSFRPRNEDYWTPHVRESIRQLEQQSGQELIGRLAPGVMVDQARRELQAIAASVDVEGWSSTGRRLDLVPLLEEIVGDSADGLNLVTLATAVFLAIVCANVALLTLARSDRRSAEFATRKAIGATRSQLVRFALIESLMLSAAGAPAGIALSYWVMPVLRTLAPAGIPRLSEATIDERVLGVAVGLSILTGIASGLSPAFRLSQLSVIDVVKRGGGTILRHRVRFQSALVIMQVGATVVLLVLAGLIGRTFLTLLPLQPGFESRFRSVFPIFVPPAARFDRARSLEQLLDRVRAVPGVQAAAVGSNVPFGGDDGFRPIHPLDGATTAAGLRADLRVISEDYLRVLGIPVSGGRMFSAADGAAPVGAAIVNQTFARKLGGDVIGRRLRIESGQAPLSGYEIVGVVGDARSSGDTTGIWDEIYIPLAQANPSILFIVVESTLDARTLDGAIRRELRSALPERVDDPIVTLTSMEALVGASLARPRFSATLIGAFSANALLLAAIGVFSLITYSVAQRQPEFGLRAALGADSRRLLFMVLNSTAALVGVGMGTGLVGALYATRLVASQLYGVDPLDVPTFVGSTMLMTLGAGVAAYLPARRASRVDPMVALRGE